MVVTSKLGVVHDLATSRHCAEVSKLRREFSEGRECYVRVSAVQVVVYKLPGCRQCFGNVENFRLHVRSC